MKKKAHKVSQEELEICESFFLEYFSLISLGRDGFFTDFKAKIDKRHQILSSPCGEAQESKDDAQQSEDDAQNNSNEAQETEDDAQDDSEDAQDYSDEPQVDPNGKIRSSRSKARSNSKSQSR